MSSPNEFIPLSSAVFHILLALAEGERHGYAIMQGVQALSGGRVRMGPGTLYGSIKRMLEAGLIVESGERPDPELDDQRRRYYKLTSLGERILRLEVQRLAELLRSSQARSLLPDTGSSRGQE